MSLLDRLIAQLEQRGLKVGPGKKPGELFLHGDTANATPELMAALKAFKAQLVERYGTPAPAPKSEFVPAPEPEPQACRVCGRDVSDPEDRAALADPAHCDRGGARPVTDGCGNHHEGCERCPYK